MEKKHGTTDLQFAAVNGGLFRSRLRNNRTIVFEHPIVRVSRIVLFLLGVAGLCQQTAAAGIGDDPVSGPTALVELMVQSADGKPVTNRIVEVVPGCLFYPSFNPANRIDTGLFTNYFAKTDRQGIVRFLWTTGEWDQVQVAAEGVGIACTGAFEVRHGSIAKPHLPRLVPFGIIDGVIPAEAKAPGRWVEAAQGASDGLVPLDFDVRGREETEPGRSGRAQCDSAGHFVLKNVPCGVWWLRLRPYTAPKVWWATVFVAPGQQITKVYFHSAATVSDDDRGERGAASPNRPALDEIPIERLAGTVQDQSGQPIEGAMLLWIGQSEVTLQDIAEKKRQHETYRLALSDRKGRWKIATDSRPPHETLLVAYKAGYVPIGIPMPRPTEQETKSPTELNCDMTLSSRGGGLELTVARKGVPAAKVAVRLTMENYPYVGHQAMMFVSEAYDMLEVRSALNPCATTDDRGIARFTGLIPGQYKLDVADAQGTVESEGVAIRAGETCKYTVVIGQQQADVPVHVLWPRNIRPDTNSVRLVGNPVSSQNTYADIAVGGNGVGVGHFNVVGLWHLTATMGEHMLHERNEACGLVGASPLLRQAPPSA